jgi:hypothetical protein
VANVNPALFSLSVIKLIHGQVPSSELSWPCLFLNISLLLFGLNAVPNLDLEVSFSRRVRSVSQLLSIDLTTGSGFGIV